MNLPQSRSSRIFASRILASLMALLFSVQECGARMVSLDVQHDPSFSQFWMNRSYFVETRKKIEEHWTKNDPRVGCDVHVPFIINTDGSINDIPGDIDPSRLQYREIVAIIQAAKSIESAQPFPPLPPNQQTVTVVAIFKSRAPRREMAPIDRQKLLDGLLVLGLGALVGFGIYSLAKSASNNSNSYILPSGRGCQGHPNCVVCSNCSQCQWCNSGGSPCGVWYRSR